MKLSYIGIASVAALALAFAFISTPAEAATSFTVRGIADKTLTKSAIYITSTYASASIKDDVIDKNIGYSLSSSTKYYKYVNKKKVPTSWSSVRLGHEVVAKGNVVSGSYKVTELTINDRSFSIVGKVSDVTTSSNTIKVNVSTSTYKQPNIKGKDVAMTYSSKTVCMQAGSEIGCSEILSDGQKIKVEGGVTGTGNTYELLKVWNKY